MSVPKPTALSTGPNPSFCPERPVFAVVIGIDEYQSGNLTDDLVPSRLYGCEKDAKNIYDYLVNTLHVPERNVKLLINEQATRKEILDAVNNHFFNNRTIKKNDVIIFYFAGHGARLDAPAGWPSEDGKVEAICPYDTVEHGCIPDRTLSARLRRVAEVKGNNIIAIFDSCHSGGMGRRIPGVRPRLYQPKHLSSLPADLDKGIWEQITDVAGAGMYRAMESFVLLAACHPGELANENNDGGLFTTALVNTLKSRDPSSLTYRALIHEALPPLHELKRQNPHCEGENRVRRLFSASDDGADDRAAFIITSAGDGYYVDAGWIHGVREGAEFTTITLSVEQTRAVLVAKTVEEFRSVVVLKEPPANQQLLPQHSKAKISRQNANWLHVKLVPRESFVEIIETEDSLFTIVDSGEDLEIQISDDSKTARVIRKDPLLSNLPFSLPLQDVTIKFLNRAAHFHFFLYHSSGLSPDPSKVLSVSLQQLEDKGSFFESSYTPVDPKSNLFIPPELPPELPHRAKTIFSSISSFASSIIYGDQPSENEVPPVMAAEANLSLSSCNDAFYGLILKNKWSGDLFPYVFYFDPGKYTIEKLYLPHSQESPLKSGGSPVTIGYGAFGTQPFGFDLPTGVDSDTGLIKVFVSTSHVNMEHVEWRKGDRPTLLHPPKGKPIWGAWTYRINVTR